MASQDLYKRLLILKKNPKLAELLPQSEVITYITEVANLVETLKKAIETNKIKGEDGYTPQEGKDYHSKEQVSQYINGVLNDSVATYEKNVASLIEQVEKRVAELKSGEDGKDAEITADLKSEIAEMCRALIELPNFDELVSTTITANPEAIRDSLELLNGEERYKVLIDDVEGLQEILERLGTIRSTGSTGGISKNAVIDLINQFGGTGGGHTIEDEGTPLTQRTNLNFVGAGVTVTDDAGNDATVVTISGGGGGGGGDFLADGSVPMTGDLNLAGNDINNVNSIQFDTTPTGVTPAEGLLQWNATDGTLNLGMDGGDITLQIGQESFTKVRNATGSTILNGTVVYFNGSLGNRPTISLARSDVAGTSMVQGVVTEDIANNTDGFITTSGYVRQIKTNYTGSGIWGTTWVEGNLLYVSKTNAGVLTNVQPAVPHHSDIVGTVGVVGPAGTGSILINIDRHTTLEDLSDVNGTALTVTGQLPVWDNTAQYFDFTENIFDRFDKTVDDTDDITVGATNKFATTAEKTKLGFITVTQAVDLDAIEASSHAAVTVTDSTSIDITLTGQDITAQREALTGAITASKNSNTTALGSFTLAQLNTAVSDADVARTDAGNTFTGVQTFSTPIASTSVATMTATVGGGVPTPPNNTTTFLRGDGTFATPPGGGSGIVRSIIVTSGNATAGASAGTDYVFLISGAHTITLPTAVSNTNMYTFKNNFTAPQAIATTSSQTVDGVTAPVINVEQSINVISDGTNWTII